MVKKAVKQVHEEQQPYFGVDTEEVELLRKLARTLRAWFDEEDGTSLEDVGNLLKQLESKKKNKRKQ